MASGHCLGYFKGRMGVLSSVGGISFANTAFVACEDCGHVMRVGSPVLGDTWLSFGMDLVSPSSSWGCVARTAISLACSPLHTVSFSPEVSFTLACVWGKVEFFFF